MFWIFKIKGPIWENENSLDVLLVLAHCATEKLKQHELTVLRFLLKWAMTIFIILASCKNNYSDTFPFQKSETKWPNSLCNNIIILNITFKGTANQIRDFLLAKNLLWKNSHFQNIFMQWKWASVVFILK